MSKNKEGGNLFAVYIASGRIVAMLLGFAMPLFLTRFLTKNDYGLYTQFYTLLTFFGSILAFGIQSNLFYFYPTTTSENKKKLIGNTYILLCYLGIIGSLILVIPGINNILIGNEDLRQFIYIISICICFFVPVQILLPLIVVENDKWTTVIFPPSEVFLRLAVVLLSYSIFGTLRSIFIGVLILQIILFVFVSIYILRITRKIETGFFNKSLMKSQVSYALPFGFAVILSTLALQFDKLVCISYLTATEYATYSLAFFGIPGVMQIYEAIGQMNLINMTKAYQSGEKKKVLNLYKDFITKTLSFSLPLILIVFLYSKEIVIFLFTAKYIDTIPFFRIYILSFIVVMLGAGNILRAIGKTKLSLRGYIYSSILSLPATFLLIKYYGIWGAITGAMFSIISPKIFQIFFEVKQMDASYKEYIPWRNFSKIFLYSIICIIPFVILHQIIELNILASMLLSIIYIFSVYILEIKYDVFIVTRSVIYSFIQTLLRKS